LSEGTFSGNLDRNALVELGKRDPEALVDLFLGITKTLELRVTELERQLNQDSNNSSKPPSGDGPGKIPKKRNKSRRKLGGQKGHPGQRLEPVENPDHQIELRLDTAPSGTKVTDADIIGWEKRQIFDLPEPKLIVTEYRAAIYRDPVTGKPCHSDFPAGVNAPTGYGTGALGLMVYFHVQQHLPLERVGMIFSELFGQPVSDGTILKAREKVAINLEEFEEALRLVIMVQMVLCCDETGFRVKSKQHRHWLHVMCTEQLTYYAVHDRRGAAIPEIGILPGWKQRLVHDCLSSYDAYCPDALHCLCNPHVIRELTAVSEEGDHQAWAEDLIDFLESSNKAIKERGGERFTEEEMVPHRKRIDRIIERGKLINPENAREGPELKKKGRKKRTKAQNLIIRFEKRRDDYLRFMTDEYAPFSNNLAERDLRMMKLQMKISGCFRTLSGAEDFTRIRSYISTLRKNGGQIFNAIKLAVTGSPLMPEEIIRGVAT
jgi:transposase